MSLYEPHAELHGIGPEADTPVEGGIVAPHVIQDRQESRAPVKIKDRHEA
jgi:hypothetical protein